MFNCGDFSVSFEKINQIPMQYFYFINELPKNSSSQLFLLKKMNSEHYAHKSKNRGFSHFFFIKSI